MDLTEHLNAIKAEEEVCPKCGTAPPQQSYRRSLEMKYPKHFNKEQKEGRWFADVLHACKCGTKFFVNKEVRA